MVKLNINGIGRRTARLTMPVGQAGSWLLASGFWLMAYGSGMHLAISRHPSPFVSSGMKDSVPPLLLFTSCLSPSSVTLENSECHGLPFVTVDLAAGLFVSAL